MKLFIKIKRSTQLYFYFQERTTVDFLAAIIEHLTLVVWIKVSCILIQKIMDYFMFPAISVSKENLIWPNEFTITHLPFQILTIAGKTWRGHKEYSNIPEISIKACARCSLLEFLIQRIKIGLINMDS